MHIYKKEDKKMFLGGKEFDFNNGKSYVMGILNVTPDSFSDGGKYNNMDSALKHTEEMIKDGADIIDIGGESTRPGAEKVPAAEEIERVCPVIEAVKKRFDIPLSLDTFKAETARAGLEAGADIINDIWGLKYIGDAQDGSVIIQNDGVTPMAELAAEKKCPVIIMHNRAVCEYKDYMKDVISDIKESIAIAKNAGVDDGNIILDPGIGFAKTLEDNLVFMARLKELVALKYPVLLGISNKSIIGKSLDLPMGERTEATIALDVIGRQAGCSIFRVHDVKANRRALDMTDYVLNSIK